MPSPTTVSAYMAQRFATAPAPAKTKKQWPIVPVSAALAARIRAARIASGMSQVEFARRIGVAGNTGCQFERGRIRPSIRRMEAISRVLKIPLAELLAIDPAPRRNGPLPPVAVIRRVLERARECGCCAGILEEGI